MQQRGIFKPTFVKGLSLDVKILLFCHIDSSWGFLSAPKHLLSFFPVTPFETWATRWPCTSTCISAHRRGQCNPFNGQVNFELRSGIHGGASITQRIGEKWSTWTLEENYTFHLPSCLYIGRGMGHMVDHVCLRSTMLVEEGWPWVGATIDWYIWYGWVVSNVSPLAHYALSSQRLRSREVRGEHDLTLTLLLDSSSLVRAMNDLVERTRPIKIEGITIREGRFSRVYYLWWYLFIYCCTMFPKRVST